ncbi:MAG: SufD family Fe-S cluster assembly protein [Leptospiraceae bacterium]|nr:SufD family Fe-S cluster assembly protein [Leptospiraceae bacterium]MDW7976554.1 SufD family Fe-S cluster assembly protein [Leptospiraceae bacterium]
MKVQSIPNESIAKYLNNIKHKALQVLEQTQLPPSHHESWRKINIHLIPFSTFRFQDSVLETKRNGTSLFVDFISDFEKKLLLANYDQEMAREFNWEVDYFGILNVAFLQNLNIIRIPKNSQEKQEISIQHLPQEGNSFFPFTIVVAERNSEVVITEEFRCEIPSFWSSSVLIYAEENARVYYYQIRHYNDLDFHFHRIRILQKRDSYVHAGVFHLGGNLGKGFIQARLLEENAQFRGIGFFLGGKGNYHNMEMDIYHLNHHQSSSLLYKTIVKERAHSVFIGKLESLPKIRGVESHQLNQNLILSKKAKAESRPWLIVRSENVNCEHGATSGDLDEEALFYLQARGLNEEEAKKILIIAFMVDLVDETQWSQEKKDSFLQELINRL